MIDALVNSASGVDADDAERLAAFVTAHVDIFPAAYFKPAE